MPNGSRATAPDPFGIRILAFGIVIAAIFGYMTVRDAAPLSVLAAIGRSRARELPLAATSAPQRWHDRARSYSMSASILVAAGGWAHRSRVV
jgi:hypothetical protein